MMVKLSTYNNEALASICLGYYTSLVGELSFPKAMIILPFVLHEQTARRLRGNSSKRSLDEFIIGNTDCLINFNKRYIDFLPISLNACTMLNEMGIVSVSSRGVVFNRSKTRFDPYTAIQLGKRANVLLRSIDGLVPILFHEEDWSAYLKLKIVL
jgi:hypothetical protein